MTRMSRIVSDLDGQDVVVVLHTDGVRDRITITPTLDGFSLHIQMGTGKRLHDFTIDGGDQ